MVDILDPANTQNSFVVGAPSDAPPPPPPPDSLIIPPSGSVAPASPPSPVTELPLPPSADPVSVPPPEQSKKKGSPKGLFIVLLLLLITLPIGVYYISQQASLNDLRNRAAGNGSCFDKCTAGGKGRVYCNNQCGTNVVVTPKAGGGGGSEKVSCGTAGSFQCGKTPSGCGGFCISGKTKTCDQMLQEECNFSPTRGGNYVTGAACTGSGTYYKVCSCPTANGNVQVCFDRGVKGQTDDCHMDGKTDRLCDVYSNTEKVTTSTNTGITTIYLCENEFLVSQGKTCSAKVVKSIPSCYCGTVQVDTPGSGYKGYEMRCGCGGNQTTTTTTNTPTQTPTSTPTNTPTNTPTGTPSVTPTRTPTPTPPPACNSTCSINSDCPTSMICSDSRCRNAACQSESSCSCPATATPTPTPPPVVYAACNSACTVNTDCVSGLVCVDSFCRNPSCTEKTTCSCDVVQTPETPIAGAGPSVLGASVISVAALLLLFGLAL